MQKMLCEIKFCIFFTYEPVILVIEEILNFEFWTKFHILKCINAQNWTFWRSNFMQNKFDNSRRSKSAILFILGGPEFLPFEEIPHLKVLQISKFLKFKNCRSACQGLNSYLGPIWLKYNECIYLIGDRKIKVSTNCICRNIKMPIVRLRLWSTNSILR